MVSSNTPAGAPTPYEAVSAWGFPPHYRQALLGVRIPSQVGALFSYAPQAAVQPQVNLPEVGAGYQIGVKPQGSTSNKLGVFAIQANVGRVYFARCAPISIDGEAALSTAVFVNSSLRSFIDFLDIRVNLAARLNTRYLERQASRYGGDTDATLLDFMRSHINELREVDPPAIDAAVNYWALTLQDILDQYLVYSEVRVEDLLT